MEDINSDDEDSVMPPLICPEESYDEEDDPCEYPSDPPYVEPTPEPVPPSGKTTKEPTSKPSYHVLSEPSAPIREGYMGHLSPGDIVRYQKGSDLPILSTLDDRTKEAPWIDTWKSGFEVKSRSLEAGEDLPNPTKIPYQTSTKL